MKRFITLLMALLLFIGEWTPSMAASQAMTRYTRHSFCIGGTDGPSELAARIERSLKADPSGKRALEGCRATVLDFLTAFQANDPDAGLKSVGDLPRFLREDLVLATPEPGVKYWSACKDDQGRIINRCIARAPHEQSKRDPKRTEQVWKNRHTGKIDLQGDCANPVEQRDIPKDDCNYIDFVLAAGDEVHIGLLGPEELEDKCLALWKPSEGVWNTAPADECPRDNCDFSGPSRDLRLPVRTTPRVSFRAEVTGTYTLRVPASVVKSPDVFVFCVIRPDGRQSHSTFIFGRSYRQGHAMIGYKGHSVPPANWPGLMHTWLFMDGQAE